MGSILLKISFQWEPVLWDGSHHFVAFARVIPDTCVFPECLVRETVSSSRCASFSSMMPSPGGSFVLLNKGIWSVANLIVVSIQKIRKTLQSLWTQREFAFIVFAWRLSVATRLACLVLNCWPSYCSSSLVSIETVDIDRLVWFGRNSLLVCINSHFCSWCTTTGSRGSKFRIGGPSRQNGLPRNNWLATGRNGR